MDELQLIRIDSRNWQEHKELLREFCLSADQEDSPAARNISWTDWENNPASLMNTLAIQKRYDSPNGSYEIITYRGIPVAGGGCYISDWSSEVMVAGVRTWTHPNYRDRWWHGDIIIPKQAEYATQLGKAALVLTFNNHNERLRKFLQRIASGKAVVFGARNAEFYTDLTFVEGEFLIKNSRQSIAVKLLNCDLKYFEEKLLPVRSPS